MWPATGWNLIVPCKARSHIRENHVKASCPSVRVIAAYTIPMSVKFDAVRLKICRELQILLKVGKKNTGHFTWRPRYLLSPATVKSPWMCSGWLKWYQAVRIAEEVRILRERVTMLLYTYSTLLDLFYYCMSFVNSADCRLQEGWRTFLMSRAHTVYKFRRSPFACTKGGFED